MKYENMIPATFIERPNRFIAYALLANGEKIVCHVKNTGRCKELLYPGVSILLQFHPDAAALGRKTEYSLIGVYKDMAGTRQLINMDSQAPNQVAFEWLSNQVENIKREVRFGNSRFDLAFTKDNTPGFMEVKGVTLEENGIARFPDAPTLRGIKHMQELEVAAKEGYLAYILFVIAMKGIHLFEPNRATHPQFADALIHAQKNGVKILAYDCIVTEDTLQIDQPIPIKL